MSTEDEQLIADALDAANDYEDQIPKPAVDFVEREAGRRMQFHLRKLADRLAALTTAPEGDGRERLRAVLDEPGCWERDPWGSGWSFNPDGAIDAILAAFPVLAEAGEVQHCWKSEGNRLRTWCGANAPQVTYETREERLAVPVCAPCHQRVMHFRADALEAALSRTAPVDEWEYEWGTSNPEALQEDAHKEPDEESALAHVRR